jgi:pyruvate/2-oxoglutarate dehydrogenase complex dihydrolipoamide dehydrogenase (E3) component
VRSEIVSERYDDVVIGTGQGGKPLARALARAGRRTAVIEKAAVGGTCVNVGCTPTKTMVASARVAHLVRRAPSYGVHVPPPSIDLARIRRRKRDIVESFRSGSTQGIEKTDGLELVRGDATFTGPHTLEVATNDSSRTLEAERIFLNVGGRNVQPPIEGLGDVPFLDSTSIMELEEAPAHLVVIGGGYVGCEFAQMFRRFGSQVTLLVRGRLLGREDEDVSDAVAEIFRSDSIEVSLGAEVTRVRKRGDEIEVGYDQDETSQIVRATHLLVATGRRPNTDDLGLENAGVETDDHGYVVADEHLRTTADHIYALGDVVSKNPKFTHIAYDDYRIIEANVIEGRSRTIAGRPVPYTVFIDPPLGRVGLTEREARDAGHDVRIAKIPMSKVARALETDETRGFMKAVIDGKTDRILGCAFLGLDGAEVATIVQTAMMGDLPYTALRDAPISHPTTGESLNTLFAAIES